MKISQMFCYVKMLTRRVVKWFSKQFGIFLFSFCKCGPLHIYVHTIIEYSIYSLAIYFSIYTFSNMASVSKNNRNKRLLTFKIFLVSLFIFLVLIRLVLCHIFKLYVIFLISDTILVQWLRNVIQYSALIIWLIEILFS